MTKIGLLSDTHGHIDDIFFKHLSKCDEVWHAGDIGNIETADKLAALKPFKAVYGNIDNHTVRLTYPQINSFTCENCKILITHIGGYPGNYYNGIGQILKQEQPHIFITGHSHILKVMWDKKYNLMFMNPGAAGKSGFHKKRTILKFDIDKDQIKNLEIVELDR